MTLVIAGHDITLDTSRPGYAGNVHGLFVTADSTITDGRQTLLSGFKKIYQAPIKVYRPYFNGPYFQDYFTPRLESNCFIAFAGSTITAQHVLNGINNHLSLLRYGHEDAGQAVPGTYQILMDCEPNSLRVGGTQWAEDMFMDRDVEGLLTGEVVARVVLHAIHGALATAKQHKIDQRGWDSLLTQYVIGTYCEREKRNRLYTVIPSHRREAGVIVDVDVALHEVPPGELAVLGMQHYKAGAVESFDKALNARSDVKKAMFEYLNGAIDEVVKNDTREINRPAILSAFSRGDLVELDRRR
ncbi:hypothetical protein [Janthinobacterium rivuli]|uniref:hypothetical protein n=1 Tax=Janthinobacterium rivuli TaxID=2751478 RepID=UPI00383AC27F